MKRREFIRTGLATMAVGASGPVAVGEIIAPLGEDIGQTELGTFTMELDRAMDHISLSGGSNIGTLLGGTPTGDEVDFFRASLRSLLLIGNFNDLPIKGQVHPWMQKRMIYSEPEVNYSVETSIGILKNMPEEDLELVREALNEDPDLGDRILESLDLDAGSVGINRARRRQMKVMGKRIVRRLRHSPEMFLGEYINKAEKLMAANNSEEAMDRLLKSQMGEDEYTARIKKAQEAALLWKESGIPDSPVSYSPLVTDQDNSKTAGEALDLKKRKGLRLLGIGLVVTVAGFLLVALFPESGLAAVGVVAGVTVGPIMMLTAIIVLIIHAIKSRKSRQ